MLIGNFGKLNFWKGGSIPLPLDSLNSAVAYSVRKLRTAYSGSTIKVRRSSDNAEQDIGFTSDGDLDTTALQDFVGSQNLLPYSEEFDNAVWTRDTVTPDVITAPNGTMTADLCQVSGTSTQRHAFTAISGETLTFSCYLKIGTSGNWARFAIFDPLETANMFRIWANLATGEIGVSESIGTGVIVSSGVENVGNGWHRFWMTGSVPATSMVVQMSNENSNGIVARAPGLNRYQWGAQLTQGTLQPYTRTEGGIAGDGFVTTWYDQSGNERNATQVTASSQPQIVNAGVVETVGTYPAIVHDGVDDGLVTASWGNIPQPFTRSYVIRVPSSFSPSSTAHIINTATGTPNTAEYYPRPLEVSQFGGNPGAVTSVTASEHAVFTSIYNGAGSFIVKNGVASSTANSGTNGFTGIRLGGFNGLISFSATTFQDLIVFQSALSTADRQTLEQNQGDYYGITIS